MTRATRSRAAAVPAAGTEVPAAEGTSALGPAIPALDREERLAGSQDEAERGAGRVAGIPVGVHWTVAVILVIIAEILGASVLPAALPHQPAVVYWAAAAATALVFAS